MEFGNAHYLIKLDVLLQLIPPPCTLDNSGCSSLIPEIQKSSAKEGQVTGNHLKSTKHMILLGPNHAQLIHIALYLTCFVLVKSISIKSQAQRGARPGSVLWRRLSAE